MNGWQLLAAHERYDFELPHPQQEPEAWQALGQIWLADCGHLSDEEFIAAIEAHRRDPEYGAYKPETCDVLRQDRILHQQRTQAEKAAKHEAYITQHKQRVIAPKEQALAHIAKIRAAVTQARHTAE